MRSSIAAIPLLAVLGGVDARAAPHSLLSVNASTWDSFNQSVSGHLYNALPMLAPCYTKVNGKSQTPDAAQCNVLQSNRSNTVFVADHFGGYINPPWGACQATGDSCEFGTLARPDLVTPVTKDCSQGSVPGKYVEVHGVEDVQKTLNFASQHRLRLVIKNTGHDYKGRSSAPDSLALWTHPYQPPIKLNKGFTPEGCSSSAGDVITFGAGQEFGPIYDFAHQHNYRIVGGTSTSVGAAGGWITGGGHSLLSNELGLGVDNVQELKAVLPNGTYVIANRCQNQDIFFALRGGGGGTFGVVMEMSTLAHPEKPMELAQGAMASLDPQNAQKFISILVANADKWASEGWGGYIAPGIVGNQASGYKMATAKLNHTEAQESMKPLTDFVKSLGTLGLANVTTSPNYYGIVKSMTDDIQEAALPVAMSSRIIRKESFEKKNQKQLSSILGGILTSNEEQNILSVAPLLILVTAPTSYSQKMPKTDVPGGLGAASVTPAWRDGLWHIIHLRPFDGALSDPAAIKKVWQAAHDTMNPLREFTPGAGAYQNEADTFEPDPVGSFWGKENYDRLLKIKKEIDPDNLLTVHQGVGWEKDDARYGCYPELK